MKRLLAFILLFFSISNSQPLESISFPVLGKVEPQHARDIRSSNWSVGAETMDRDYTLYANWKQYLGPLGIKKARIQAGWARTEKEKSVYHFGWLDNIVFDMQQQGVEPWMCLCYGNFLYSPSGIEVGSALPREQSALEAWEAWVRQVVVRYGEVIDEWEVWNEPNNHKENTPQVYADFLMRTATAVRDVQPNAIIIAFGLGRFDISWIEEVLKIVKQAGKLYLIDEVTYHPYKYNPDESYPQVAALRQAIARYSDRITIRQGECGAPSTRLHTRASLANHDWSENSQSKWALRRLLGDLGRDIPSSIFAMMDMKYPAGMNIKGLLKSRDDQTVEYAKPAYVAVQALASIFDHTLERIPGYAFNSDNKRSLSLFGYENRYSGLQGVTVWFDDLIPSDTNEMTKVDFTFYAGIFEKPILVDLRQARVYDIPDRNWSQNGTVYEFTDIPVYDSPVLIADKSLILIRDSR